MRDPPATAESLISLLAFHNARFAAGEGAWRERFRTLSDAILRRRALYAAIFLDKLRPGSVTEAVRLAAVEARGARLFACLPPLPPALAGVSPLASAAAFAARLLRDDDGGSQDLDSPAEAAGSPADEKIAFVFVPTVWLRNWVCGADVAAAEALAAETRRRIKSGKAAPGRSEAVAAASASDAISLSESEGGAATTAPAATAPAAAASSAAAAVPAAAPPPKLEPVATASPQAAAPHAPRGGNAERAREVVCRIFVHRSRLRAHAA